MDLARALDLRSLADDESARFDRPGREQMRAQEARGRAHGRVLDDPHVGGEEPGADLAGGRRLVDVDSPPRGPREAGVVGDNRVDVGDRHEQVLGPVRGLRDLTLDLDPSASARPGGGAAWRSRASGWVIVQRVTKPPSRWTSTAIVPTGHSRRTSASGTDRASTYAVPISGCPANGSSVRGMKIRTRAVPPRSAGSRKTISERLSSRAIACILASSRPEPFVKTASGLPFLGPSR